MKVTINDIARITEVSKSTISRVINESGPVSKATRKKVLDAIEELQYEPNEIARSLSLKRTKTIGVVVQDIRNPYYAHACWYAERFFKKYSYRTIICNADNDLSTEASALSAMRYRNVDGILCIGVQEDDSNLIRFLSRSDIPLTLADREISGYEVNKVTFDNMKGGAIVVRYLLDLGHTRIAVVTSNFTEAERKRIEGFLSVLREREIPVFDRFIIIQSEEEWHRGECAALEKVLTEPHPPTAIFASNDFKAVQVLNILKKLTKDVPGDVTLVGYDDVELSAHLSPPLTTVHQPVDQMIEKGAQMLLQEIQGLPPVEKAVVLEPWLVERESSRKLN